MEAYLRELKIFHCVQRTLEQEPFFPAVEADDAAEQARKEALRNVRREEDAKCVSVLLHKIADSQLERIRGKRSPKAIWDTLQKAFDKKGVSGVFLLLNQFTTLRYDEEQDMEEHILEFERVVRELEAANIKFVEPVQVFFLLQSMPKSYAQLITVLKTLPVEQCSMEFIKSRLLNEDVERHHLAVKVEPKAEPSSAFAGKGGKFTFKCHACGKPEHKKANCPEKEKAEQAAGNSHRRKKGKAHAAETKDGANDDVSFVSVAQEANSVETHGKFR